jgi:acyl-CoA hydrolase
VVYIKSKKVEESKVCLVSLMQPGQSNIYGNIHGGEIMKLMDNTAGIVARKHARTNVVTARVDKLEFHLPIHIGNLVTFQGQLTFVGKKSMEVLVKVLVEDLKNDEFPKLALTGYFTMVALDEDGIPTLVPSIEITNDEELKLYEEGKKRYLDNKKS